MSVGLAMHELATMQYGKHFGTSTAGFTFECLLAVGNENNTSKKKKINNIIQVYSSNHMSTFAKDLFQVMLT